MSKISKPELKALFTTGRKPSQQDFANLIDSLVHLDDQSAVDLQVVNTRISAYDTALKARQIDGEVNTLGDVFALFAGWGDNHIIGNELNWSGLPGKPVALNLSWTEQTIVTDSSTYNPLANAGTAGAGPAIRWLNSTVAGLTGSYLVMDVRTDRRWVDTGGGTGFFTDTIVAVKVAITPKTNL